MNDYSWMKTQEAPTPTQSAKAEFALARADNADRIAADWAAKGDEVQAQRFRAQAASLRGEA